MKTCQTKEPQFFYDGNEREQVSGEDMKIERNCRDIFCLVAIRDRLLGGYDPNTGIWTREGGYFNLQELS